MDFNEIKINMEKFNREKFMLPEAFYNPGFMWSWNDKLAIDMLSDQMKDMKDKETGNVLPLPLPIDFRPLTMPTYMEPDYLSEEYLSIYKQMLAEAEKLDMHVWLYDEGGWPSGSACGGVVAAGPELGDQRLEKIKIDAIIGDKVDIPSDCLAAFIYEKDKTYKRLSPGSSVDIVSDICMIEIYKIKKSSCESENTSRYEPPYPDLLNPEATREFIRQTHEKYKRKVGQYFGNVIKAVFTDEPRVSNPPWTEGLAEAFCKEKGYDLLEYLPLVFNNEYSTGELVRIDFFDWWSSRFAESYFETVRAWCHDNSLLLAGHLGGDNEILGQVKYGYGHILRILRKFDIPGIDTIWRQIFPGVQKTICVDNGGSIWRTETCVNHYFPKFAASVAHQEGKKHVITESFCVYGSGLTPEEMKWVINFQYVRGVNLLVTGTRPLSTEGHFMAGERPMFGPFNPMWKYISVLHSYAARMSYILSLGKPAIEMAVYFPVRDIWAGGTDVERTAELFDNLAGRLLELQCDFDFIDDDILEKESTVIVDGMLVAGHMRYDTVLISRTKYMTERAQKKLVQFASNGGRVLITDSGDDRFIKTEGADIINIKSLKDHISPVAEIFPENRNIRFKKQELGNGSMYLITNEGNEDAVFKVLFKEVLPATILDCESGQLIKPSNVNYLNGGCEITVRLQFSEAVVFMFSEEEQLQEFRYEATTREGRECVLLSLDKNWEYRKLKSYEIGTDNFVLEEYSNDLTVPIMLGDWREKVGEDFSGDIEYSIHFNCSADTAKKALFLNLGKVRYACECFLNGKKLGRRIWQPFEVNIKGILHEGENELCIIVTNTMANQYVHNSNLKKWPDYMLGPYHKIVMELEKDSLIGGLFGPVSITL